ncbi:MAG: GTPase Era [Buchnera aphidicola (Brevicoryne brassicae)]|uniref:GTPase Era n=1 Tax=Buchnera aphidicola (Brevicoryne brassicae) TaxID=911343 RepID=A0AAJ5PV99_9GAMM|nr:GTPase Era [Buchnera aphidicola]QCI19823.1 GTPase Era [Buchnera aphidicola (Brevicoryne brassicae)]WAI19197.1 MAG: GTPase Era [Buchnera aphidicola (Brevicoryne brassicae)]
MNIKQKYCGYITIIGKANVGKSTLINKIIGKKISIVSRKKNTTQNNIIGVKTQTSYQSIYIDTPGIIFDKKGKEITYKENYFYKIIKSSALIILVIDRLFWTENDEHILYKIKKIQIPIIIIINKIDKIQNKNILLPFIDFLKTKNITTEIVPISAKKTKNIVLLNKIIQSYLPKNTHIYPKDYITENSHFFTTSEIIREKLISFLADELPSIVKVKIEYFQRKNKELYIRAIILVQNTRQKKIVIGNNAEKIKKISIISRYNIEKEFSIKTHLALWVKVNFKKNKM